ncbi:MAG TPA: helix-turn-helix transcriptional regulator [Longimicrobiales bacterium]|nr:helix-turn-helix transcriptional regulator [Longimicrobiales bacterium]
MLQVLDLLQDGLRICDPDGATRRENGRMVELLDAEPERERVEEEIQILARSLSLLRRNRGETGKCLLERTIRTEQTEYRLHGVVFTEGSAAEQPLLVILQPRTPTPITDEVLRRRARMTEQEIRIARLLAEGKRNRDIARQLRISVHTTRHHVEHVLSKLGVRRRAEVGPVLNGQSDARLVRGPADAR